MGESIRLMLHSESEPPIKSLKESDAIAESLFAVVPCYNVENTLPFFLHRLSEQFPLKQTFFINDGSTDKTADVLKKKFAQVHHHESNCGKGKSLKHGYGKALQAGATWVFTIDSDLQHSPSDIPKFLEVASQHDIVIGSRRQAFCWSNPVMPLPRKISNRITSGILSKLCDQPILDSQCGFRFIKRDCLERVLPKCRENGFMFETEFLLHAANEGFSISFVDIEVVYGTAKSHMRYVIDTLNFIKLAVRFGHKKLLGKSLRKPR
ncbi:glycosyl transferase family 2 [Chloroherpeton thalassium ATCC 35110]|uniref:Glycosyl transferase family 2 n=1 Tax=Chloroherpeton thalassium (strain ATCC 35110 / GB-78) TaxID=517418 RepID=B3QU30_CHLT3|nr:glycosyltransferase family 2 protein [Chloroherpeton thalassium]ACF12828.1 glycosyl transferase family 2 [Chloroherpeton thalassium ATCC 35110]